MQCRFEIGQRVCCIESRWCRTEDETDEPPEIGRIPSLNEILTIAEIRVYSPGPCLSFIEVGPWFFSALGFRPLDERDISIEQFERLLVDLPERVGERV